MWDDTEKLYDCMEDKYIENNSSQLSVNTASNHCHINT